MVANRRGQAQLQPTLPARSAWPALLLALLAWLAALLAGESLLAARGYLPTARDDVELWVRQRAALAADPDAITVLGSSRAQVGIHLPTLAARSGRSVYQLALDYGSFVPVLEGLAADPDFRGLVLVDFLERFLVDEARMQVARNHETQFRRHRNPGLAEPSAWTESRLAQAWRSQLRLYADGAGPLTNLLLRVLGTETPQYMVILPDRSRLGDYTRLDLPRFRLRTVARYLDLPIDRLPWAQGLPAVEQKLREAIETRLPPDVEAIDAALDHVVDLARRIEARGGRVLFLRMPSSGLILEAERRWYPRERHWARLEAALPGRTRHFEDVPEWRALECPDGSHLDASEVRSFTEVLASWIAAAEGSGAGGEP